MSYPGQLVLSEGELCALVEKHLGFQVHIAYIREGYMSTVVFLDAVNGQYVLKIYRENTQKDVVLFGFAVNDALQAEELPVAPRVGFWESRGRFFVISERLKGRLYTPGAQAELRAAGDMLGRIHALKRPVEGPPGLSWPPMWNTVCTELETLWGQLEAMAPVRGRVRDFRRMLRVLQAQVEAHDLTKLPAVLIHGDYRAQNLLFDQHQVSGVIDLDMARPAQRLFDVTYGLAFFQAVIAEAPLDFEEMAIFLSAYGRHVMWTSPEKGLLPVFLNLSLMRGITLWMRIAYLDGVNSAAKEWLASYEDLISDLDRGGIERLIQALEKAG